MSQAGKTNKSTSYEFEFKFSLQSILLSIFSSILVFLPIHKEIPFRLKLWPDTWNFRKGAILNRPDSFLPAEKEEWAELMMKWLPAGSNERDETSLKWRISNNEGSQKLFKWYIYICVCLANPIYGVASLPIAKSFNYGKLCWVTS